MDKTLLVDVNVEQAAKLIRLLDKTELEVHSALWLYSPEEDKWRLVIATPMIERRGPQRAYMVIQKILANNPEFSDLSFMDISLVSERNSKLINTLRKAIQTGKEIANIRFSRNVIDGEYLEDAIILRMQ
jgi:hypothetical protein